MLNPATDKYTIEFSKNFFDDSLVGKYDDYLYHLNSPIKNIVNHIHESVQSITIPGFNLNVTNVVGLSNLTNNIPNSRTPNKFAHTTVNKQFPGNSPLSELFDSQIINLTLKNTVLNWMFFYEVMRGYYERTRTLKDFYITITVMDAAEIPLLQFIFSDCFVANMPGLTFASNEDFRESKTIDAGFAFNKLDIKFLIPKFNKVNKILTNDE